MKTLKFLGKLKKMFVLGGSRGSGWGGVRVDVNEELIFLGKFKKEFIFFGGGRGGGLGRGVGLGGQGGCDRIIEVFGNIPKKNWGGGSGGRVGGLMMDVNEELKFL